MFELSVALKYFLPRKRNLSVALIGLMSVSVISLVVWLVLVFLSVTDGMEKNWLKKLTDLNAPIKIVPTSKYYDSYYHKVDTIASSSNYQTKTIEEKALSSVTDPYDPEEDREIPTSWPEKELTSQGELLDPVKSLYTLLSELQDKTTIHAFQDFEMSGALLKLQLLRSEAPVFSARGDEKIHFITQATYVGSFPDKNPFLSELLLPPTSKDIEHLLFLSDHKLSSTKGDRSPDITEESECNQASKISRIVKNLQISQLKTAHPIWQVPHNLLSSLHPCTVLVHKDRYGREHIVIPDDKISSAPLGATLAFLSGKDGQLQLTVDGKATTVPKEMKIFSKKDLIFDLPPQQIAVDEKDPTALSVEVETTIQGKKVKGLIPWDGLEILSCSANVDFLEDTDLLPLWTARIKTPKPHITLPPSDASEYPVVLPKSFQDNGVMIGDRGFLSYSATTVSSTQEQRLGVFVAGFYDPGIMSVGNKCILAPRQVTRSINSSNTALSYDKISLAGVQVWLKELSNTGATKEIIELELKKRNIDSYFSVISYKEYDFAKELLQQFQSDKYLFSLIAILIITVACCNIISLLILLVNDKKKEIGILLSMGARPKSIAMIFGLCGIITGALGCAIGCAAAFFTLKHIDSVVQILSILQGHDAFSTAFFGTRLPDTLSSAATVFVLIATPILALLAGLIPAVKACKLRPSCILRSQ